MADGRGRVSGHADGLLSGATWGVVAILLRAGSPRARNMRDRRSTRE